MTKAVRAATLFFALLMALPASAAGQAPGSVRQGLALYRGRCANCHGVDARGFRAPDLTNARWSENAGNLFQIIRRGIRGTDMPGTGMQNLEIRAIMAYLGTVSSPGAPDAELGDRANGERIFWETANCGVCHRVGERGGYLGPDLTRIGRARSRAALVREIRNASEFIVANYDAVTLVTGDGSRVRGAVKNEDTFSIQIMDSSQRLRAFLKSDLRELTHEDRSLMPDYPRTRLSDRDLDDLIRYLGDAARGSGELR